MPNLKTAEAAGRMSVRLDDSNRVIKSANDELGFRYDPSNAMLNERKPAQQKLATAHQELLVFARQAGMAEIATGVLHDLGNVLNIIDVSATRASDRIRQSNVTELVQAVAQMEKHFRDLGTFVADNRRGTLLPRFPKRLADPKTDERGDVPKEFELPYVPVAVDV